MLKVKLKPCDGSICNGADAHIWKNHDGKKYCQRCWAKDKPKSDTPPKPRVAISRVSDKRSRQEVLYYAARKVYLKHHPTCHANIHPCCSIMSTDVHHQKGRIGDLLLDQKFWLPVCRGCHDYIELHPEEAIENGWSLSRLN
jgi:hypothetical protein